VHFPAETNVVRPWQTYANNPLRQRAEGKLIPQVRVWLEGKIPEYMRPASYVVLDSLPLTGNGKVNRRALPVPEEMRPEVQNAYAAPRTPVEELIAAVFADVLRIDRAGAGDDFFELGGHSLSATQVVSRIRQAFQIELPVRALFESPTVRGLAIIVETIQRGNRGFVPPPIAPVSRGAALPLSIAQQRLWILDQMEPNSPLYNVPRAIRMTGTLNEEALERALNGIVQRHEVLRTTYRVQNDGPVQVIAPEMRVPFQVVDLGLLPPADREQEAHRIIQEECGKAFDLARDEMIRATLLKLDGQEHILFLNTHHIASDGWSNGVFMRDLSALYQAGLNGTPSPLSELAVQYADYAVWQRNWLQGGILEDNLNYWKARLHGAPPTIEIPTDRPRPSAQSFEGASHVAVLPASLMDAVRTLGRQQEATVFMTLLAAFKILMLYYSKQPDIVVGTDVAGRNDVRTEALIGFFVNLLVLRTDLSGDPSVPELLRRVRETALGAYAHQDAPFDRIVEELRPGRSLAHNPLVQILFVQMSRMHAAAAMPGLELSPVPMDLPSKFDLAVFAAESAQDTTATWVYSSDLFDAATIQRMAFLYEATLRKMTADPGVRLNVLLRFLAETEQRKRETENQEFQKLSLLKLKRTRRRASAEMNAASGV
jgi:acyl carrier protein